MERNSGKISVLNYRKPTHTGQYLHYNSVQQASCTESVFSYLFNRAFAIIANKDDSTKENARIKQGLKKNGYQKSIIGKIFKKITNNHSFAQSQQQMQPRDIKEEEIRMSINLLYVEGTRKKLR